MESFPSCLLIAVVFNFLDFFLSDFRLWIKETKQKKKWILFGHFCVGHECSCGKPVFTTKYKVESKKNWRKVDFEVTLWFLYRFFLMKYYLGLRSPWLGSDLPTPIVIDINTIEVWAVYNAKTRICSFDIPHTPYMKWYLKSKTSRS